MAETLRAFIALEVTLQAKEALGMVQARWRTSAHAGVRWVDTQGLHLTLRFLGDIPRRQVEAIARAMERATQHMLPLTFWLGQPGAFPSARRPRVLWVSVEGDTGPLQTLYQRLETEMLGLGFPRGTRPLSPHLTLGRVPSPQEAVPLPEGLVPAVRWETDHLDLMRSTLLPAGAHYTRLASVLLTGEG